MQDLTMDAYRPPEEVSPAISSWRTDALIPARASRFVRTAMTRGVARYAYLDLRSGFLRLDTGAGGALDEPAFPTASSHEPVPTPPTSSWTSGLRRVGRTIGSAGFFRLLVANLLR
jgi:hypothetical protein